MLDVQFDYLSPPKVFSDGYGRTPNMTPHLEVLPLNHLVLYPRRESAQSVMSKTRSARTGGVGSCRLGRVDEAAARLLRPVRGTCSWAP